MRQNPPKLRRPGLLAAAFAVAMTALVCALALPTAALADEDTSTTYDCAKVGSKSFDNEHLQDAMDEAANSDTTLVMTVDWDLSGGLYVPEGKKVTVDMDGHRIDASKCQVFSVHEKGELVLTSSKKATFTYRGYSNDDGKEYDYEVTTGGLITSKNGRVNTIRARGGATVTLDGVTIAGSIGWSGSSVDDNSDNGDGAVSLAGNTTLNMKNGASIEHCNAIDGAGVCATGGGVTINMDASSISNNWGSTGGHGGGVRVLDGATIKMTNGSHIDNNHAGAGGGIYFAGSNVTLTGDGTGTVSGNKAVYSSRTTVKKDQSGGGIHVAETSDNKDGSSLIEKVTITNNYSAYDGGGIELDHKNTKVKNCTIKDNWCKYEGGGAYVCDDGNTFENCTITGNSCSVDSGGNYEGGGVYVWHSYDVVLNGVCVIKGNNRGYKSGNADDVFLRENGGGSAKAYITGSLKEGSAVGVRTGTTGDRRIAKNFTPETKDCLFYDLSGYYVSYGTDSGGDAWQRHTTKEFTAKVDGESQGKYRNGSAVTLVTPATKDDNKVFWYWDTDRTTGLHPVGDYISGDALYNNVLNFTMPQNDVNAIPRYIYRAEKVEVRIDTPVAGQAFPATAKVRRDDHGFGGYGWATASMTWYEVDGDTKTQVSGTAKPGTKYQATIYCASDKSVPLYFDKSLNWGTTTVTTGNSDKGCYPDSALVDSATGALTVVTNTYKTDGEKPEDEATGGKVSVKMVNGGIEAGLGGGNSEAVAVAALSDDEAVPQSDDRAVLGEFDVSWTEGDADVVIIAPAKAGYNFCNWEGVEDSWVNDDVAGTVTVPFDEVGDIDQLVAVYTPVVTEVEIEMDEPSPTAGATLATSVSALVLTGSDGSTFDLVKAIDDGDRPVTWSPESENGKAGFSTAYTALIDLADAEGLEGVDQVLSANATIKVTAAAGVTDPEVEASGFTVVDGRLCLAVSFAATRDLKATGVEQPQAVEVSFEDAAAGDWQLPKTVEVKLENGEVAEGDVEWEAVEGFNAGATTAQELQVKGAVTRVAYDGDLDTEGLDLGVSVTVKVAAPASDDSKTDDDTTKTETTTTTETKKASKKGTPATGDASFTGAAALLAAAAVCLGAARFSRRRS